MNTTDTTPATLTDLCDALNAGLYRGNVTELPTYGGGEPADTLGIYSWDATRVLRHDSTRPDGAYYLAARD